MREGISESHNLEKNIAINPRVIFAIDIITNEIEDYIFLNSFNLFDYVFFVKKRLLTHRIIAYHTRPIYNDLFNQGLKENDYKNRVCNHTLRHTFASHLAINGISLFEIQKTNES